MESEHKIAAIVVISLTLFLISLVGMGYVSRVKEAEVAKLAIEKGCNLYPSNGDLTLVCK